MVHPELPHPSRKVAASPDPRINEADCVARIRTGDESAFEALFRAYHVPLCDFVLQYLRSQDLAEEVVQDVFLFVWEHRAAWELRGSLKGYLFTAARNAAISYLRHQRVEERNEPAVVELFPRSTPGPEGELHARELAAVVRRVVDRLPARRRLIFTLHRRQGFTYAEIAALLGLSPKTVDVQMGRALLALKQAVSAFFR